MMALSSQFENALIKEHLINQESLKNALLHKKEMGLLSYLARHKIIAPEKLASLAATIFNLPLIDLAMIDDHKIPLHLLPIETMKKANALLLKEEENHYQIAVADPGDSHSLQLISFYLDKPIHYVIVDFNQLTECLKNIAHIHNTRSLHAIKTENAPISLPIYDIASNEEEPLIRFINHLLKEAAQDNVSDIHFEIYEKNGRVRFRQDGLLYEKANVPLHVTQRLIARLKVMSKLNIAEHRIPQDGHCQIELNHQKLDIRTSSCPTQYGEKIVLRLLTAEQKIRSMEEVGLNQNQHQRFLSALNQPHGLIIVTGPTGSGKTSTLYAALQYLNRDTHNILTIEDPIEINLPKINQTNINPKANMTFSTALRAFLRQDPDIIMIGEIRDTETAEIAIKAAQTGHLVLSTLHTNSAIQTMTRLQHMGIPDYHIKSSVTLITAQRLIRKLCHDCKKLSKEQTALTKYLKLPNNIHYFTPVGCKKCHEGYSGRTAIHEVLPINETNPTTVFETLQDTALNAIKEGITSPDEIQRTIIYNETPR